MANRVSIDEARDAVKRLLTELTAGVKEFCQPARLREVTCSMEIVFPDGTAMQENQSVATESGGNILTTQTEQPFEKFTETVKTGSYTQAGTQGQTMGGGSDEEVDYTYDEIT